MERRLSVSRDGGVSQESVRDCISWTDNRESQNSNLSLIGRDIKVDRNFDASILPEPEPSSDEIAKPGAVRELISRFDRNEKETSPNLRRRNTLPACTKLSQVNFLLKPTLVKDENPADVEERRRSEFKRNSAARKSLPSSMSKFYSKKGADNTNVPKPLPRKLSLPLSNKTIFQKPDIPSVLLKNQNSNSTESKEDLQQESTSDPNLKSSVSSSIRSVEINDSLSDIRCGEPCFSCRLVDLWFLFLQMEQSKL